MISIKLRIRPLDEPGKSFPDVTAYTGLDPIELVVEEGVTSNGKTGVQLHCKDKSGKDYLIAFTANMFMTLAAGVKGARERWGDPHI